VTTSTYALEARAAAEIAQRVGELLRRTREHFTGDPADLKCAGDRVAHRLLVDELHRRFPADGFLSEEGLTDGTRRSGRRRTWIVDPLDGTREYAEGRQDWAVHVALVADGVPVVGAVALPDLDTVLSTGGRLPRPALRTDRSIRLVVSRTRPPAAALAVADALGAELVPMGSAGAKAMAVVRGVADVYLHAGGQYEWDSAAPVAVATVAGFHASRLDGSALRYDQPDPWLPDVLVCHPLLTGGVSAAIEATSTAARQSE
jgi:3'(2'), 5'-bisphosphate nucleotidase